MTVPGSQGHRLPANSKTDEIPLVYCGRQTAGSLNTGQGALVKKSMWFLNDHRAHLGNCSRGWRESSAGYGVVTCTDRLNQPPHVNMWLGCSVHGKVSMEKCQPLRHYLGNLLSWSHRNWTSWRPPSISGLSVPHGLADIIFQTK